MSVFDKEMNMNPSRFLLAVLLCIAMVCLPAAAATYYVASQDPKADDTNAGTEAAPFKAINAAIKGLKPGDTLLIKGGTYRESIRLGPDQGFPSGKSYQEMITFAAYPGQTPVIKGSEILTGWKQHKDAIWYTENAPAKPKALPIVYCDGKHMEILSDWGGEMSDMMKRISGSAEVWKGKTDGKLEDLKAGWYFYDKDAKRLYVWLPDGSDPRKHLMEIAASGGCEIGVSYVKFSGLTILQSSLGVGGNHNIVENCESSDASWGGCGVYGEFNTIVGCKFNRCGDSGMGGSGRGHRIINCETSYNNFLKINAAWHAGGCKFIPFCSDIVISGHVAAYNVRSPGIWFDWGNFNITIENSICHHNGNAGGIMYEVSERGTFRNNICYDNYGRGIFLSNSSDCQVLNNVFWHNGMCGVEMVDYGRPGGEFGEGEKLLLPSRNNVIWGNIFVDNCHPDFTPTDPDGRPEKGWEARPELAMSPEAQFNTGNISDYNIFFRGSNRVLPFCKGGVLSADIYNSNLADWQKKTGFDLHSIVAEPLFVDAARFDFRPAKGSPAIDFVKPRMGAVYDMYGKLRPMQERKDKKPLRFTAGPFEVEGKK